MGWGIGADRRHGGLSVYMQFRVAAVVGYNRYGEGGEGGRWEKALGKDWKGHPIWLGCLAGLFA